MVRIVEKVVGRLVDARDDEARGAAWAFLFFLAILTGYSVLKPVRDEMAIAGDLEALEWLFTGTFVGTLLAVPVFSWVAARVSRRRLVTGFYRFCGATLVAGFVLLRLEVAPEMVARAFFIWVSVFNLFLTSLFWAFLSDVFTSGQGKRLFGFVAAGGTVGAIAGPLLAATLAPLLGPAPLLLLSAGIFEGASRCAGRLGRWARDRGARPEGERPVGGPALAGFTLLGRSPYLLAIAGQTLLFAVTSTLLYAQYLALVEGAVADPGRRVALFGFVDSGTQALTLAVQLFLSGRILSKLGLGVSLSLQPLLSAVGLSVFSLLPFLGPAIGLWGLRRSAHHAVERPAREVLFTTVDRESRYKAKSAIDTVVYRGGDAVSAWLNAALGAAGLATAGVALAAVPFAAAGIGLAWYLARRHAGLVREGAA
jgi:AAA family ATP:ADP antiporter